MRVRLSLQRRGPANLRRHLVRAAVRFGGLVTVDLASFVVMRALVQAVRDHAVAGEWIAGQAIAAVPRGILNGWQFAAALLVGLFVTGNYGPGDARRDPRRLFIGCALATALPLWMTLWTRGLDLVVMQYVLVASLAWLGLTAERLTIDRVVAWFWPAEKHAARTLFVGPADECREAIAGPAFTGAGAGDSKPVGFVDVALPAAPDALGHIAVFPQVLDQTGAEAVVVSGHLPDSRFREVVDAALAAGCHVFFLPRALEIAGVQPAVVSRRGQALIELTAPSLKGRQLLLKRTIDLVGASLGLLVAAPLMLVIALAIKLDSPGPVLFRQQRIGTGGRRFRLFKFRTMRQGASDAAHRELIAQLTSGQEPAAGRAAGEGPPVYKLVDDARITRVGRWLRGASLDELPQLLNVARGEMSLVGPRPPLPYEFEAYDHWQFDRLQVLPGMTGLWQVSGRNLLTYREMCELDVAYVRRWSVWLDLKILLKTIPVVLFNSGRAA